MRCGSETGRFLILAIAFSASVLSAPVHATDAGRGVELTYLANEGFLITAGDTKILVDALFGNGIAGYEAVPGADRRRIEEAQGPFAGVDLVLVSHFHRDHFDPRAVGKHLRANPRARFVSTRQAVDRLRAELDDFAEIRDRVAGFWPGEGARDTYSHAGVRLTLLHLHHGHGRRPPVENLGFLIDVGGVRLLHVGDTEALLGDVRPYALREEKIDVALVPYWYFFKPKYQAVLPEIGPKQAVVMHMGRRGAPAGYFHEGRDRDGLEAIIRKAHPDAWIPARPMVAKSFGPWP